MSKLKKAERRAFKEALARAGSSMTTPYEQVVAEKAGGDIQAALNRKPGGGKGKPGLRDIQRDQRRAGRIARRQEREVRDEAREKARAEAEGKRNEAQSLRAQHQAQQQAQHNHPAARRGKGGGRKTRARSGKTRSGMTPAQPAFFAHESAQTISDLRSGNYGSGATGGGGDSGPEARVPSGGPGGGQWTRS